MDPSELLGYATTFTLRTHDPKTGADPIYVEHRGNGRWAISDGSSVLNSDNQWEYEPFRSDHTAALLAKSE